MGITRLIAVLVMSSVIGDPVDWRPLTSHGAENGKARRYGGMGFKSLVG
jgi:hypothetical protein